MTQHIRRERNAVCALTVWIPSSLTLALHTIDRRMEPGKLYVSQVPFVCPFMLERLKDQSFPCLTLHDPQDM